MPDTFRKSLCRGVLPVFQILTLLKLLILALAGKSRNIISNGSFWLILYLFSIHQINMYMPSTAAPKPCPTLVQKAGPKIWTIFRQKWQKKSLTLLGGTQLFSRTTQANRLTNKHLALLTVCQFLPRPSTFGHFSLQYNAIRASYFYIVSLNLTSQLQGICTFALRQPVTLQAGTCCTVDQPDIT